MNTLSFYDAALARDIADHERGAVKRNRLIRRLEWLGRTLVVSSVLAATSPAWAKPAMDEQGQVDMQCVRFVEKAFATLQQETGLRPTTDPSLYCGYQPVEALDGGYSESDRAALDALIESADRTGFYAMGELR